jgi:plastocyanin
MKSAETQPVTIKYVMISSILILSVIASASMVTSSLAPGAANAQTTTTSSAAHIDSSPVVTVFVITKDNQGNLIFLPNSATIKPGEEILVLNNDTKPQTVLSGKGPDDPLSGKLFSIGHIQPKTFLEYGASNLQDGKYSFYLQSLSNVKGELTVVSS